MNLSRFSRYINPAVAHRGKEYASEGRVISLESIAEGNTFSVVRGNEIYEIIVKLNDEGNIIESECDCPYDFGPVCKHQVADFSSLRIEKQTGHLHRSRLSDYCWKQKARRN